MERLQIRVPLATRYRVGNPAVAAIAVAVGLACIAVMMTFPLFAELNNRDVPTAVAATALMVAMPIVIGAVMGDRAHLRAEARPDGP